jgi:diacylglycerol O-acyltransferase / trehalose O-mycolyltransferase
VTAQTILARKTCFRVLALALIATTTTVIAPTTAVAEPAVAPGGAHITGIEPVNDRWEKISVFSPSMNKVIVNDVLKAPKAGAPTFYLLPGIDGGDNLDPGVYFEPGSKAWFGMTDIQGFFGNRNVNVVSPLGGQFSWWTDWIGDGSKQYQTYMTKELPPLLNKELKTNGKNAVGGLSSTGGTAIDYAIQAPGLFKAVGSYSGFPAPSDPDAAGNVSLTLSGGGASAEAMWGPLGGPLWVAHDPSKNVTKLKGVAVYAAASGGAQGDVDRLAPGTANFTGGLIEGIVLANTQKFADAAAAAGVPVKFVVRPEGSHTWGLFESEMQESWNTTIGPALGVG